MLDLTPYWINRVFLHAIILQPDNWTELFTDVLQQTLDFVVHSLKEEANENGQALMDDSYRSDLVNQLSYLSDCRTAIRSGAENMPERPENMILLPRDIRTVGEWKKICNILTQEEVQQLYITQKVRIDKLIAASWTASDVFDQLTLIPQAFRQDFVIKYLPQITGVITTGSELYNILRYIPVQHRLQVALNCQDKIESCSLLTRVARTLPEAECATLLYENQAKITRFEHILYVVECLPREQRLSIVINNVDKIDCLQDFYELRKVLPKKDLHELLENCPKLIHSYHSFFEILKCLPREQRLKFATAHKNLITDIDGVMVLLPQLPEAQRLQFASDHQPKLKNTSDLKMIISVMPRQHRLQCVNDNRAIINNAEQFIALLKCIPKKDRLQCVNDNRAIINNTKQFIALLMRIPKKHRRQCVIDNRGIINTPTKLAALLKCIAEGQRLTLIRDIDFSLTANDLISLMKKLPKEEQVDFLMLHHDKIMGKKVLLQIMYELHGNFPVEFATKYQDKIKDFEQFTIIEVYLPEDQKKAYVIKHCDKISHVFFLENRVSKYFDEQWLDFAQNCPEIFTSLGFSEIFRAVPKKQKAEFAFACQDKVKYPEDFGMLARYLSDSQWFDFANNHIDIIEHLDALMGVLMILPTERSYAFALNHLDKIKNSSDLAEVLSYIPKHQQVEFKQLVESSLHVNTQSPVAVVGLFAGRRDDHDDDSNEHKIQPTQPEDGEMPDSSCQMNS